MDKNEALRTFTTGENFHLQHYLGAHQEEVDGKVGYSFRVWAPNAQSVHLIGDFTNWYENQIPMARNEAGVWEVFTDLPKEGDIYKYNVKRSSGQEILKIDPLAVYLEERPGTGAVIRTIPEKKWKDGLWLARRKRWGFFSRPVNIYEVHAGSWKRNEDGSPYSFAQLKEDLIPYLVEMNYTHVEFMPLMAHPLGLSWGYQLMGYFAFEHTYGTPEEFQDFVEECHLNNIGVIVDWVPGHFCRNANALAYYDGTPTFEYQDVNRANNVGWGTLNFDLGKNQVQSFLISNAMFWLKECHLDGLRVDAVSNMLYLDFDQGPWTPNEDGSNHNRQGVAFLQKLNTTIKDHLPHVLMIAEESTDWKGITHAVSEGGLGFDYKWNMGWMNDTLRFFETDPYYRPQNFRLITFVFMYQYNERYVLPFSHDEVVHGKKSLLDKIPGSRETQFETLRLLHGYMMAQPGKKLHFMGNELGQYLEWRYYSELEWKDLSFEFNREYQHYMKTLNHIGKDYKALHYYDTEPAGLTVLDADNVEQAVLTMMRQGKAKRDFLIIALNFIPVERQEYRIGVPYKGEYEVLLNSQMQEFGGRWTENLPVMKTEEVPHDGQPYSIVTTVPSLGVLYIKPKRIYGAK